MRRGRREVEGRRCKGGRVEIVGDDEGWKRRERRRKQGEMKERKAQ